MMVGIVQMSAYTNYWAAETRVNIIADTMSRKRYKELRRSIHLLDNTLQDQNKQDKLFKIRPLLEIVLANCLKVEQQKVISKDSQIILSKTKRSRIRQFNLKKPVKWGFKIFLRAGASGIIYVFFFTAVIVQVIRPSKSVNRLNCEQNMKLGIKIGKSFKLWTKHETWYEASLVFIIHSGDQP